MLAVIKSFFLRIKGDMQLGHRLLIYRLLLRVTSLFLLLPNCILNLWLMSFIAMLLNVQPHDKRGNKTNVRFHLCCHHYSAGHSFSLKCLSGDFWSTILLINSAEWSCFLHLGVVSARCIENTSVYFKVMVLTVQIHLSVFSIFSASRLENTDINCFLFF